MKRTLIALIAVVGFAATVNAATLTVTSDKSQYAPGENIVLSVVGTSDGVETATAVFARLDFAGPGTASFVSSSQTQGQSFGGAISWTLGNLASGADFAVAINQIIGLSPLPATLDATGEVVLQATGAGAMSATILADTAEYFGAAPGGPALFTIVPEPTTAGLLGMGLLSLAVAGRRR